MKCLRGDIVLADLPYSDRSGSKVRPALVVQSDRNNQRLDDVILVLITRTTTRVLAEPTQFLIDVATSEGQQTGLLHTSAIKCEHILTLHRMFLKRTIGRLRPAHMQSVSDCIKIALGLT